MPYIQRSRNSLTTGKIGETKRGIRIYMTRAAGLCRETQDPGQVKHRLTSETCHPHAVKLPFCPCNKRRKKRTLTSLRRAGFQKLGLIVSWRLAKLHFSLASLINDVAHACDAATSPLITGCGVLKLKRHSLLGPGTSIHWADARPAVRGLDIFERCADGPMDPKHKSCALATQLQHSPMSAHLRSGRRGAILSSPYPSHNALTSSTPRCRLLVSNRHFIARASIGKRRCSCDKDLRRRGYRIRRTTEMCGDQAVFNRPGHGIWLR